MPSPQYWPRTQVKSPSMTKLMDFIQPLKSPSISLSLTISQKVHQFEVQSPTSSVQRLSWKLSWILSQILSWIQVYLSHLLTTSGLVVLVTTIFSISRRKAKLDTMSGWHVTRARSHVKVRLRTWCRQHVIWWNTFKIANIYLEQWYNEYVSLANKKPLKSKSTNESLHSSLIILEMLMAIFRLLSKHY